MRLQPLKSIPRPDRCIDGASMVQPALLLLGNTCRRCPISGAIVALTSIDNAKLCLSRKKHGIGASQRSCAMGLVATRGSELGRDLLQGEVSSVVEEACSIAEAKSFCNSLAVQVNF